MPPSLLSPQSMCAIVPPRYDTRLYSVEYAMLAQLGFVSATTNTTNQYPSISQAAQQHVPPVSPENKDPEVIRKIHLPQNTEEDEQHSATQI